MKAPDLKKLDGVKPEDDFTKAVDEVSEKASAGVRKTFSMQRRDFDYINSEALRMSQELGRIVGASEALRDIIDRARR